MTKRVRFGEFELDLQRETLSHGGERVHLRPQCWALLAYLAERGGAAVARAEIERALWPDTFVAPNPLHYVLWDLRRTLARYDERNFVVTTGRRGYRLLLGDDAPPIAAQPSGLAPLLDRATELQRLHELYRCACDGQRQLAFVVGEAGIGKSTVLQAFERELRDSSRDTRVATARCLPMRGVDEPYAPLLEVVERLSAAPDFVVHLRRLAPTWAVQLPGLLPQAEIDELRRALAGIGAGRMVREGVRLLEAAAAEHPIVVIVEDLSWADAGTLTLLEALAARGDRTRLMVVASLRWVDLAPGSSAAKVMVDRLCRAGSPATKLALEPLGSAAIRAYVDRRFREPAQAAALAAMLEATSGGNPLFLAALADYLVAAGVLHDSDGAWSVRGDLAGLEPQLSHSVRGMIADQLALAETADLELLEAASVCGPEFSTIELAAALQQDLDTVDTGCARLVREERFLLAGEPQEWPDGKRCDTYRFRHILYQRALYDRIAPERRRGLHRRVGRCLETGYGEHILDVVGKLTSHFGGADDLVELARYQEMAAGQAAVRFAPQPTLVHVQRALTTIRRLPPSAERDQREVQRLLECGSLAIACQGFQSETTRAAFDQAYEIARRRGLTRLIFRAQLGRCFQRLMTGFLDEAAEIGGWLVRFAASDEPELLAMAEFYCANAHMPIDLRQAEEHNRRAIAALVGSPQWSPPTIDLPSALLTQRALVLCATDRVGAGLAEADRARGLSLAFAMPATVASNLTFAACAAVIGDHADMARDIAVDAVRVAQENDIPTYSSVAQLALLWADDVRAGDAVERFERAVMERGDATETFYQGLFEIRLAERWCIRGAVAAAQRWLDAAFALNETLFMSEAWRVQGDVYRRRRGISRRAIADCYRNAVALADGLGTTTFKRRAEHALAELSAD